VGCALPDFFRDVADGERDVIALQVVTMRRRVSEAAHQWFAEDPYPDYFYLHGLSAEMAETFAEYLHKRIRDELGFAAEEARDPEAMLAQGYRGSRYSFGYPACPNLADQKQLLALLGAGEIGITLSEEDQLDPEQSTSAIVVHHPQAKYFSV
jgi:5-methyltetrahydrofolate--homocysteine methyltransferase